MNEVHCPQFQNEASAPLPTVQAEFHVERHPDPIVQSFIDLTLQLRKENDELKAKVRELEAEVLEYHMGNR